MIRRPPRSTLFPYTRSSDLCMDNDDLRRGRPTTHRAFDVATATRAGYHMVALAARVLAAGLDTLGLDPDPRRADRKSTRLNSSHGYNSYARFFFKKKKKNSITRTPHYQSAG